MVIHNINQLHSLENLSLVNPFVNVDVFQYDTPFVGRVIIQCFFSGEIGSFSDEMGCNSVFYKKILVAYYIFG